MNKLAALAALCAWSCLGQASATITLSNGVRLRINSSFGRAALTPALEPASGNSFYRVFRDENGVAVYAYELVVERTMVEDEFQLTVRPAGDEFAARFPNADGGKPTPTVPGARRLSLLKSGEQASIDLYHYVQSDEEVLDTVEVLLQRAGVALAEVSQAARAFEFSGLKISINGSEQLVAGPRGPVVGRFAMFYLPGRGAYFFAMEPQPGARFLKAGSIDGKRLRFTMDNESFDCTADAPILTVSESGEVWIYHDPKYRPRGNWTVETGLDAADRAQKEFFAAAADSLRWWLQ
jgi:hypothetical protein